MNTRTERINNNEYCAYCGKKLKDYTYNIYPEPQLICNCEKAKRELKLYDELKALYNAPLAEILIDMKVSEYRNRLLGLQVPCSVTTISSIDDQCLSSSKAYAYENTHISGCVYLD